MEAGKIQFRVEGDYMKLSSRFRLVSLFFILIFAGTILFSAQTAGAFNCPAVKKVHLRPTAEGLALGVHGRAEICECFGLSFLYVKVIGPVPDGTTFIPVIRGAEPVMGDWFSITSTRAETVIESITLIQMKGQTVAVDDVNFVDILTGTFK